MSPTKELQKNTLTEQAEVKCKFSVSNDQYAIKL